MIGAPHLALVPGSAWSYLAADRQAVSPETRTALLWISSAALAALVGLAEVYAAVVSRRHAGLALLWVAINLSLNAPDRLAVCLRIGGGAGLANPRLAVSPGHLGGGLRPALHPLPGWLWADVLAQRAPSSRNPMRCTCLAASSRHRPDAKRRKRSSARCERRLSALAAPLRALGESVRVVRRTESAGVRRCPAASPLARRAWEALVCVSVRIVRRTSVGVRRCPAGVAAGPANWEALVGVSARRSAHRERRRAALPGCVAAGPASLGGAGLRERAHRSAHERWRTALPGRGRRWPGELGGAGRRERASFGAPRAQACGAARLRRRWPGELGRRWSA